jgi:hypothetical protein
VPTACTWWLLVQGLLRKLDHGAASFLAAKIFATSSSQRAPGTTCKRERHTSWSKNQLWCLGALLVMLIFTFLFFVCRFSLHQCVFVSRDIVRSKR